MGTASRLIAAVIGILTPSTTKTTVQGRPASSRPAASRTGQSSGGPSGGGPSALPTATVEVSPPGARGLRISYAPDRDGAPDGGEIVWTWVPYDERDGRGKDRPVLVIARRDATSSFAVRLTSKPHDGERQYLGIGLGAWDPQGRPSWVDVEQIYVVHDGGMRREAAALDRSRFDAVAGALRARYGWRTTG